MREHGVSLGRDENALKLTMVMDTGIYEYTKNHRTVYFKWVTCMAYELDLSKAVMNTRLTYRMQIFIIMSVVL